MTYTQSILCTIQSSKWSRILEKVSQYQNDAKMGKKSGFFDDISLTRITNGFNDLMIHFNAFQCISVVTAPYTKSDRSVHYHFFCRDRSVHLNGKFCPAMMLPTRLIAWNRLYVKSTTLWQQYLAHIGWLGSQKSSIFNILATIKARKNALISAIIAHWHLWYQFLSWLCHVWVNWR